MTLKLDATGCPINLSSFVEFWASHIRKSEQVKYRNVRSRSVNSRIIKAHSAIGGNSVVLYRELNQIVWQQIDALISTLDRINSTNKF